MIKLPEVPDVLKTHNWTLYEQSMSADPSIATQYIIKLCVSLKTTMMIAEINDYDDLLNYEMLGARRAWKEYNDGQIGRSMQTVTVVLTKVGKLLYDGRFSKAQVKAFTGRD